MFIFSHQCVYMDSALRGYLYSYRLYLICLFFSTRMYLNGRIALNGLCIALGYTCKVYLLVPKCTYGLIGCRHWTQDYYSGGLYSRSSVLPSTATSLRSIYSRSTVVPRNATSLIIHSVQHIRIKICVHCTQIFVGSMLENGG